MPCRWATAAWGSGHVSGLLARGGFVVDLDWHDGRLTKARILSRTGAPLKLRTNVPVKVKAVAATATTIKVYDENQFVTSFPTKAGKTYETVVQ